MSNIFEKMKKQGQNILNEVKQEHKVVKGIINNDNLDNKTKAVDILSHTSVKILDNTASGLSGLSKYIQQVSGKSKDNKSGYSLQVEKIEDVNLTNNNDVQK